jgi:hypothetical protein
MPPRLFRERAIARILAKPPFSDATEGEMKIDDTESGELR